MDEQKSSIVIIGIVAIVAIVGLVMVYWPGITGQAQKVPTTSGMGDTSLGTGTTESGMLGSGTTGGSELGLKACKDIECKFTSDCAGFAPEAKCIKQKDASGKNCRWC